MAMCTLQQIFLRKTSFHGGEFAKLGITFKLCLKVSIPFALFPGSFLAPSLVRWSSHLLPLFRSQLLKHDCFLGSLGRKELKIQDREDSAEKST